MAGNLECREHPANGAVSRPKLERRSDTLPRHCADAFDDGNVRAHLSNAVCQEGCVDLAAHHRNVLRTNTRRNAGKKESDRACQARVDTKDAAVDTRHGASGG
jgi:hypothetical protein